MVVKLTARDGVEFETTEEVVHCSTTIGLLRRRMGRDAVIPLPRIDGQSLAKVLEYCRYHSKGKRIADDEENPVHCQQGITCEWDEDFIKMEENFLLQVCIGAHYLKMEDLQELMSWAVANVVSNKSVQEIRRYFSIENDFSQEEEATIGNDLIEWLEQFDLYIVSDE